MSTSITGPVRVRFPPSPTGFLHVGGARTAIYNDLLRQSLGGALVLRIEDTDRQRSDEAMSQQIRSALDWIGVVWDEGPFLQSERVERHREVARQLLAAGSAYHCFQTPETLEQKRREAEKDGFTLRYRSVFEPPSQEEVERRLAAGDPYAVRFRMPDHGIRFHDLVRGEMDFPPEVLDDFVILRSDGSPTYHLSVVVDDADLGITHVIRGEDHLSNTPKHYALYEAMGEPLPSFGHLPLILGPDRKRLSKRTGATSVEEFRHQGILPEALYNYLALLGWSPGDDREVMSREEMIACFTVERLGGSASVFDYDKLKWINAQHMSQLPYEAIRGHLEPYLAEVGLTTAEPGRLRAALDLHRTRAHDLGELARYVVPYFTETLSYDPELCRKFIAHEGLPELLEILAERYAELPVFDLESTESVLRALAQEHELKAGVLIHPTRMALTASKAGPPLFDVVVAMGQEAGSRHLRSFAAFVRAQQVQPAQPAVEA